VPALRIDAPLTELCDTVRVEEDANSHPVIVARVDARRNALRVVGQLESAHDMRPVDQTTYGVRIGNCFSACIASILELPIEDVPSFASYGEGWTWQLLGWLVARDLSMTYYDIEHGDRVPPGFSIAGGPSTRFAGQKHACVAHDGNVIHDPHPSRDGLPFGIVGYVALHGPNREVRWFNGIA
jgi:hypothetical protein